MTAMDKFSYIEPDPLVRLELNAAFCLSIDSKIINHYAGLFVDPSKIRMIIKKKCSPQIRRYYDSHHGVQSYNALDEDFTAQLSSGEKIECHYFQLTPASGRIQARVLVDHRHCFAPLPIPQNNFFILKDFHEKSQTNNTLI